MENQKPSTQTENYNIKTDILGVILISLSIFCFFGLYTNTTGSVGRFLDRIMKGFTGSSAVFIPFVTMVFGIIMIFNRDRHIAINRIWGIIILFIIFSTLLHINAYGVQIPEQPLLKGIESSIDYGQENSGGGVIGYLFSYALLQLFGKTGAYIVLCCSGIIGFILTTNISIVKVFKWIKDFFVSLFGMVNRYNNNDRIEDKGEIIINKNYDVEARSEESITDKEHTSADRKPQKARGVYAEKDEEIQIEEQLMIEQIDDDKYKLPPKSLLKNGYKKTTYKDEDILKNAKLLEKTLESFGVKAKVSQVSCGPAVTRYEVQPAPGIKVSRIITLADDIALSLAASDVRIEAPIPGKAAVGIEVPNKDISIVTLKEVIESRNFKESKSKLTIALGKDIAGSPVVADLAEMPHLLVAGATGSGKSVCINAIIASILFKATPNDVKLLLIDPKVVELTTFNGIPHLITPVVTDPEKASSALNWVVREMERRYRTFAKNGARDIKRYNKKMDKASKIPEMVVIIDELADLMMIAPTEVEDSICRLAQKARAAGIHLVVATQRPSVDVITGVIKANIPSRISFAVSSQTDSRTILDMSGAEKLLGRGDMLFYPVGTVKPQRLQGCFISEREVEKLVDFVKRQGEPVYKEEITRVSQKETAKKVEETDELFYDALKLIIDYGQASISLLQRRLHIGYTRAARIIDEMEAKGFIGGYEGTKPREVLLNKEELERIIKKGNGENTTKKLQEFPES